MKKIRLGKTGLLVTKTAFGALPIQRTGVDSAVEILRAACGGGVNFFDTANGYSDSEEKLGLALHGAREKVVIATKSGAPDGKTLTAHIELSLRRMKTDYIDLFQFHNPAVMPVSGAEDGRYDAALKAKEKGYIRHIGLTSHRIILAEQAIQTGLFETLQFPFCYISSPRELALAASCADKEMGFIAMKGLAGGLLSNAAACFAFIAQYDNVVPIWGIQTMDELRQWLELTEKDQKMTPELAAFIEADKKEMEGDFCRSCGYCLPCPAGIEIYTAARMNRLLRRAPYEQFLTEQVYEKMHRIENCIECNHCKDHCPYGLDTPALLKEMLIDYDAFYAQHRRS